MPSDAPALRTFIYGSCVSRDTFEYLRPLGYTLVEYVARQSLISAYVRVKAPLPDVRTTSPFQLRMIERDWHSRLVPLLREHAPRTDVVLWDLCDERLGIRRSPQGVATRSVDSLTSGLDSTLTATGSQLVDFATPEHLWLWTARLKNFREALDSLGLLDRTVLVAPGWAETSSTGGTSPSSYGRGAAEANAAYGAYYQAAAALMGCVAVTVPPADLRSDAHHRWGEAPFHYVAGNYVSLARQIDRVVRSWPPPRA